MYPHPSTYICTYIYIYIGINKYACIYQSVYSIYPIYQSVYTPYIRYSIYPIHQMYIVYATFIRYMGIYIYIYRHTLMCVLRHTRHT